MLSREETLLEKETQSSLKKEKRCLLFSKERFPQGKEGSVERS
jgi:hypothetical protein